MAFFHERDLVPARADQRGDGVVDIRDEIGRFGRSLAARPITRVRG